MFSSLIACFSWSLLEIVGWHSIYLITYLAMQISIKESKKMVTTVQCNTKIKWFLKMTCSAQWEKMQMQLMSRINSYTEQLNSFYSLINSFKTMLFSCSSIWETNLVTFISIFFVTYVRKYSDVIVWTPITRSRFWISFNSLFCLHGNKAKVNIRGIN